MQKPRFSSRYGAAAVAVLIAAAFGVGGAAAEQLPMPAGHLEAAVATLQPGDFLWSETASPAGPVTILVSLPQQRAYVYRNGVLIGISTVSTGKEGHETPTGVFTILQKNREHYSNLYNNAPMPFMQRLTWDGIALHAGKLPGHPASHGCIRLPDAFAEKLFAVTDLGITVVVTESGDIPRLAAREAGPGTLSAGGAVEGDQVWRPWLQDQGPVSVIVSAADRQMRVVRNAVEIGRAPVRLLRAVRATEVYQLAAADAVEDRFDWVRVPLAAGEAGGAVTADQRADLVLPANFRRELAQILKPGTTVVVTPDSLQSASFDKTIQLLVPES